MESENCRAKDSFKNKEKTANLTEDVQRPNTAGVNKR